MTTVQMSNTTYRLWCLVEGEEHAFKVVLPSDDDIHDLKIKIKERMSGFLQGIDAARLILWKPREVIPLKSSINLGRRIQDLGPDFSQFADNLNLRPASSVAEIFENQTSQLSVVVRLPDLYQYPFKRQHLDDPFGLVEEFTPFWNRLWNEQADPIKIVPVVRDPNQVDDLDIPSTIRVLHGLPDILSSGNVFIREQYDVAHKALRTSCTTHSAVVITGHPGIGKTVFLYYLLALRLSKKEPTFFHFKKDSVILFDNGGVELLSPDYSVPKAPAESWVLIDSNTSVESVPEIFLGSTGPYFVVIAAPPHPGRWKSIRHYRPNIKLWFMEPFTLEELIQAREFGRYKHREQDIQAFFEKYGPSARECFAWCSDLEYHDTMIREHIASASWDMLTKALTMGATSLGLSEGSHKIIRVAPKPEDPSSARITVITKYVNKLLWDKDATARRQNHRQLYRTLRLTPASKALTGEFFEPAFHRLCVKGNKKVILHPMNRTSVGPIKYEFVTSKGTVSETLELHPRTLLTFNRRKLIPSLNADQYYQPAAQSYHSYDSFIYDPKFSRVTAFRVTDAINHAIEPKGLYGLRDIARRSGINVNGLKIRFIIVTSEGSTVTCMVEKTVYDELKLEMYSLEMTEGDLYDE